LKRISKLASNENALGPSPKAVRAMSRAVRDVHLYPDGACRVLRSKLALQHKVTENQIVIGNGSNELIELLARGFLRERDQVLSSKTSFLVYPLISRVLGARYIETPMKRFRFDLDEMAKRVNRRTRIVFIANPNNPTGTYVTRAEVNRFLKKVPKRIIVCFDEAYLDFVEARDFPNLMSRIRSPDSNIVLLRTFSKSYGLAGLRVGYGIMSPQIAQYLEKIRQPFNVNRVAQAGAVAALTDRSFLNRTKRLVREGRKFLYREFDRLGFQTIPSQANFVLVRVNQNGKKIFKALLRKGIIVRPMNAYGLKQYIRVTIGKKTDLIRFIRAFKGIVN
jgi:histidinol-phosphate aminotransferase